jgi:hypothetical protein
MVPSMGILIFAIIMQWIMLFCWLIILLTFRAPCSTVNCDYSARTQYIDVRVWLNNSRNFSFPEVIGYVNSRKRRDSSQTPKFWLVVEEFSGESV